MFLDGQKVGTEPVDNDSYLKDNSHSVYDIGLKRDAGATLRGYLRNLTIIGNALTGEELANVTGEIFLPSVFFSLLHVNYSNANRRQTDFLSIKKRLAIDWYITIRAFFV